MSRPWLRRSSFHHHFLSGVSDSPLLSMVLRRLLRLLRFSIGACCVRLLVFEPSTIKLHLVHLCPRSSSDPSTTSKTAHDADAKCQRVVSLVGTKYVLHSCQSALPFIMQISSQDCSGPPNRVVRRYLSMYLVVDGRFSSASCTCLSVIIRHKRLATSLTCHSSRTPQKQVTQ